LIGGQFKPEKEPCRQTDILGGSFLLLLTSLEQGKSLQQLYAACGKIHGLT
jgi:hypothetical protein